MISQTTDSGKHKREATVCSMESTKDDSPLKARFFAVRQEIYNLYKTEAGDRTAGSQCGTQTKYVRARAGQWSYRSRQRYHRSRCKQADQPNCHEFLLFSHAGWTIPNFSCFRMQEGRSRFSLDEVVQSSSTSRPGPAEFGTCMGTSNHGLWSDCLLWRDKVRAKENTYVSVGVMRG